MAIGNDRQWKHRTEIPKFTTIANAVRVTNEGRHQERAQIHADIVAITRAVLREAGCNSEETDNLAAEGVVAFPAEAEN